MAVEGLSSYHRCVERIHGNWLEFVTNRAERLRQQERQGHAPEKVAENILEDLFCRVLDWSLGDLNNQLAGADLVLTQLGIKRVIVEVKRPGSLAWHRPAVEKALDQACRYAGEQRVGQVAVSDGCMLYGAELAGGGLRDRVFVDLCSPEPQEALWWLSVQGIYRSRTEAGEAALRLLPEEPMQAPSLVEARTESLLHPKYKLPARCFAYVGNPADTKTWKLPYLLEDQSVDAKRLPGSIRAILSNYRGTVVGGIPEAAIPDVLVRLAAASRRVGKMPGQTGEPSESYVELASALQQLGRAEET